MKHLLNWRWDIRQNAHVRYALVTILLMTALLLPLYWQPLPAHASEMIFVSTKNDDIEPDGGCSLREAILAANTNTRVNECGGGSADTPDTIVFNARTGTLELNAPLPTIRESLTIDGLSHPDAFCTQDARNLVIALNGNQGTYAGLTIAAADVTIRGLVINNLDGDGIVIEPDASNVTVACNHIGTNAAGTASQSITGSGIVVRGDSNQIGGSTAEARNRIAANGVHGIELLGDDNRVQGNIIGAEGGGTARLGNGSSGVYLSGGQNNVIGTDSDGRNDDNEGNRINGNGTAGVHIAAGSNNSVAGNVLAFNGAATAQRNGAGIFIGSGTGNLLARNAIFDNLGLGIDLQTQTTTLQSITRNDNADADVGPNNLQNYPLLSGALTDGSRLTIGGSLNSTPESTFTLDFFTNSRCDPSGHGEGQTYLGSSAATTDAAGNATLQVDLATPAPVGSYVTATATDSEQNSSEFSLCVPVSILPTVSLSPSDVVQDEGDEGTVSFDFTVAVSGSLVLPATVDYRISTATAPQQAHRGRITFAPDDPLTQTISVHRDGDRLAEPDETFTLQLDQATNAALESGAQRAIATLRDDDHAPVAVDDFYTVTASETLVITAPGLLGNDRDLDEDALTIHLEEDVANGTLLLRDDGAFTYTPPVNHSGVERFRYRASDGSNLSNTSTVTISVQPAPTAIELLSFRAEFGEQQVMVRWTTGMERDTWGFHLWRSSTGERAEARRMTDSLIPARGNTTTGAAYTWIDHTIEPGTTYTYWLEEVEVSGRAHEYGTAQVTTPSPDQPQQTSYVYFPLIMR